MTLNCQLYSTSNKSGTPDCQNKKFLSRYKFEFAKNVVFLVWDAIVKEIKVLVLPWIWDSIVKEIKVLILPWLIYRQWDIVHESKNTHYRTISYQGVRIS